MITEDEWKNEYICVLYLHVIYFDSQHEALYAGAQEWYTHSYTQEDDEGFTGPL